MKAAPFWNSNLNDLWKVRCSSENLYLSFKCDGCIALRKDSCCHNLKLIKNCLTKFSVRQNANSKISLSKTWLIWLTRPQMTLLKCGND